MPSKFRRHLTLLMELAARAEEFHRLGVPYDNSDWYSAGIDMATTVRPDRGGHDITLRSLSRGSGPTYRCMYTTMQRLWPRGRPDQPAWIEWDQLAKELVLFRDAADNDVYVKPSGYVGIYVCTIACDPERGSLAKESDGRLCIIGWWGVGGNWTSAKEGLQSLVNLIPE